MRSYGYLRYDPKHKNKSTREDDLWLILECSYGMVAFYQSLIAREYTHPVCSRDWLERAKLDPDLNVAWDIMQKGVKLTSSAWGPHVSVVRGKRDFNRSRKLGVPVSGALTSPGQIGPSIWGKYENKRVWFEYDPEYLNTNGKHWWIRVTSPELESIRMELGLTPQPTYVSWHTGESMVSPLHFTIGHMLH